MPLIVQETFLGYADRIAAQYRILKTAVSDMSAGTGYFDMLTTSNDPDVEIPLLSPARNQDLFSENEGSTVQMIKHIPSMITLMSAMDEHFKTQVENTDITTWDTYCTEEGVRVSDYTNKVYYARYGKYMLARNVFCEDTIRFGTCTVSPSGTIDYASNASLGLGGGTTKADGASYAGAQLAAVLQNEITVPLDIEIVGRSEVGLPRTVETTGGLIVGPSGTRIEIPPASGRFVDVYGVNLVSGGESGDAFILVNVIERDTSP